MSHSHRDDNELAYPLAVQDALVEPAVKPPAATNAALARAAAAARKAEDVPTPAVELERKFIGDGDRGAVRPTASVPTDDDLDALQGRAWAGHGPPPPRFESHADPNVWLGDYQFEAVGFADPLPADAWVGGSVPPAPLPLVPRGTWMR